MAVGQPVVAGPGSLLTGDRGPRRSLLLDAVGVRLTEEGESIRLMSFQPDSPMQGLAGLKHLPTATNTWIFTCGTMAGVALDISGRWQPLRLRFRDDGGHGA